MNCNLPKPPISCILIAPISFLPRFPLENTKTQKLYDQVAQKILNQIQRGVLPLGKRVPSIRIFSRQLGVSLSTVIHAYQILENQNVLKSRPQSGYYVNANAPLSEQEPRKAPVSPNFSKIAVSQLEMEVPHVIEAFSNPENLILSMGFPGLEVLSFNALKKALNAGVERQGMRGLIYNFPPGNLPLRTQIARHYLECGLTLSPDELYLTNGCLESLLLCLNAVARPGDMIAVESPMFAGVLMTIKGLGMKALEISLDPRQGMDLDALKKAIGRHRIKAVVSIPNFNNPMGCLMPDANKKRLVEMLAEHNIPLIENDIYGDMYLGETRPKPAKAFDKTGNVLLCSSFSKCLVPSLRVGWVAAGKYQAKVIGYKFMANVASNPATEEGLAKFLEEGHYKRHLRKLRKFCAEQLPYYTQAVARYFPEGTKYSRPAGGSNFWVEFSQKINASKLHQEAWAQKIILWVGPLYSLSLKVQNCAILSFGNRWSEKTERAMKTVGDLAKKQLIRN
jgi:DNA-binding transcriptional MocR family regulator